MPATSTFLWRPRVDDIRSSAASSNSSASLESLPLAVTDANACAYAHSSTAEQPAEAGGQQQPLEQLAAAPLQHNPEAGALSTSLTSWASSSCSVEALPPVQAGADGVGAAAGAAPDAGDTPSGASGPAGALLGQAAASTHEQQAGAQAADGGLLEEGAAASGQAALDIGAASPWWMPQHQTLLPRPPPAEASANAAAAAAAAHDGSDLALYGGRSPGVYEQAAEAASDAEADILLSIGAASPGELSPAAAQCWEGQPSAAADASAHYEEAALQEHQTVRRGAAPCIRDDEQYISGFLSDLVAGFCRPRQPTALASDAEPLGDFAAITLSIKLLTGSIDHDCRPATEQLSA